MTPGFLLLCLALLAGGAALVNQPEQPLVLMGLTLLAGLVLALLEAALESGRAVDMRELRKAAAAYQVKVNARRTIVELRRPVHHGQLTVEVEAPLRWGLKDVPEYTLTLRDQNLTFLPVRLTDLSTAYASLVIPHETLHVPDLPAGLALEAKEGGVSQLVTPELVALLKAFPPGALERLYTQDHDLVVKGAAAKLPASLGLLLELVAHLRKEFCQLIEDDT